MSSRLALEGNGSARTHRLRVRFASVRWSKALDLAVVLTRKIRPTFEKLGITGLGTWLAELREHQLTIRDYLRRANLSVTNKYLQSASKTKRDAQVRLVEAILKVHLLPEKTGDPVVP